MKLFFGRAAASLGLYKSMLSYMQAIGVGLSVVLLAGDKISELRMAKGHAVCGVLLPIPYASDAITMSFFGKFPLSSVIDGEALQPILYSFFVCV